MLRILELYHVGKAVQELYIKAMRQRAIKSNGTLDR